MPRLLSRYLSFVQMHCFDYLGPRNEMIDFHGDRVRAVMHLEPVIVSLFDPVRSVALMDARRGHQIPIWDWGTPLRVILNERAKLHGLFLHIPGRSGLPKAASSSPARADQENRPRRWPASKMAVYSYAGDDDLF